MFKLRGILFCSLLGSVIIGCVYKDLHYLIQKVDNKTRYVSGLDIWHYLAATKKIVFMYCRNSFEVYIVLIYIYFQIVQPSVRLNKKTHRWKIEKVETYNGK